MTVLQPPSPQERTPRALLSHLVSFRLPTGVGCHAFSGIGEPLARFQWSREPEGAQVLSDPQRLSLVLDLLGAINHLHSRGSAHLDLSAQSVYVQRVDGNARLALVGLGAAVRLQAAPGRSAFQLLGSPAFLAPETIGAPVASLNAFLFARLL